MLDCSSTHKIHIDSPCPPVHCNDAAQKLSRLNAELQQHLTNEDWSSALLLGAWLMLGVGHGWPGLEESEKKTELYNHMVNHIGESNIIQTI